MTDYHSHPAISRSMLADFRESPRVFEAKHITKTLQREAETNAMKFGTLTHIAILQGADLEASIAVIPNELLSSNGAIASAAAKAWKAEHEAQGKRVIKAHEKADQFADIIGMRDAVLRCSIPVGGGKMPIGTLLEHSVVETPLFWRDDQADLEMRALPDALLNQGDSALLLDVKTIADINRAEFTISDSYWLQVAHYTKAVEAVWQADSERVLFLFLFVEKTPPYRARIMRMSEQMRQNALSMWRATVDKLAERITANDWSDWHEGQIEECNRFITGAERL